MRSTLGPERDVARSHGALPLFPEAASIIDIDARLRPGRRLERTRAMRASIRWPSCRAVQRRKERLVLSVNEHQAIPRPAWITVRAAHRRDLHLPIQHHGQGHCTACEQRRTRGRSPPIPALHRVIIGR
jgi:hypothetical protein